MASVTTEKLPAMKPPSLHVKKILRTIGYDDRERLEEAIIQCGVLMGPEAPAQITSRPIFGVNSFQMPNQLAPFLLHLSSGRVRNYLEVGAFLGGTFYIVDSFLRLTQAENRSHNRLGEGDSPQFCCADSAKMGTVPGGYEGGTALDTVDRMQGFEAYRAAHLATRFHEVRSLEYTPEQVYDLVFLDGDHTYEYLRQEFAHFRPHARLIALHDIVSTHERCPGTRRFWNEIKDQFPHHEFTDQYSGNANVMGIGILATEYAEPPRDASHRRLDRNSATTDRDRRQAAIDEILGTGQFGR